MKIQNFITIFAICSLPFAACFAQEAKEPNVAGMFYPADKSELSRAIDGYLNAAKPQNIEGEIFALILPHAGYGYSGQTAGFGYKLIKDQPYKTVIILGPSHYHVFGGISVYPRGIFKTPLGDLEIDAEFAEKLLNKEQEIIFEPLAFQKEHSVEVHLPFLQKVLKDFKIVPVVMGDCTLETCKKFVALLKEAMASRKDVLVIASTDMYHGYDYQEAEWVDNLTLSYLRKMDAEGLYYGLREGRLQLCGGFGVVATLILSKELRHQKLTLLKYTNSSEVTSKKTKGIWTVGYASCAIDQEKEGEKPMLNKARRKKLLEIARASIETYLKTGKRLEVKEDDPVLQEKMGAFVTLHKHGELRGCIGHLVGDKPLSLTVAEMAVEAATGDPRFTALELNALKDIEIEISALSPLEKITHPDKIKMGIHGVLVRQGFNSGVFLPQVATETGWSKEEFMENLCAHKAGLAPDAWKDKATDIYIFTAEVFSEKNY